MMIGMAFLIKLIKIGLPIAFLLALTWTRWSEAQPSSSPSKPGSPKNILQLLVDENGLDFNSATPWHIRFSYNQIDDNGNNIRSGVFEEYYAGPRRYKVSFTGAFTQTDTATDSDLLRSGNPEWMGPTEFQAQNEVLHPVRPSERWSDTKLDLTEWPLVDKKLPCVIVRRKDWIIADSSSPKYCYDPGSSRVRYTRGKGFDQTLYNNLVQFQGRYVAKDITVLKGGKASIKIHVDTLESFMPTDAIFIPPAGSVLVEGRVSISAAISDEYVIKQGEQPHGKGNVDVHFVVGKDGHVVEADAIDGPEALHKQALECMHQYVFRPFTVRDLPVELESTRVIHFFEVPDGHISR
jgi:hypothetical protein